MLFFVSSWSRMNLFKLFNCFISITISVYNVRESLKRFSLQGQTAQAVQSDREGVRVSVPGERGAAGEAGHPHREGGQGEPRPRHQAPAPGLPGDGRRASQRQVTVTRV